MKAAESGAERGVRLGSRWSSIIMGLAVLLLLVAAGDAIRSYLAAERSASAARFAADAQRHLQSHLRSINEVLITEGSSSARKDASASAEAFSQAVSRLGDAVEGDAESTGLLAQEVRPSWERVAAAVTQMLSAKNLSASDDASMLAYGKLSAQAEALVVGVSKIESLLAPAAERASSRMKLMLAVTAALAVIAMVSVGAVAIGMTNERLGGRPDAVRALAVQLAAQDLTVHVPPPLGSRSDTLVDALRAIRDNLGEVVGRVRSSADSLAAAAGEMSTGNRDLSVRTEEQAGVLSQTSQTMLALDQTVRANAQRAREADELARQASDIASTGGNVVGQVVHTMREINESSKQIAEIIGVIDGIAFQTNILALNAAVEAARAGEQGRGFSVVASEVRSLAQRSAEAAKQIKSLIGTSVHQVEQGSSLVDRAGATMQEVVGAIQRVSTIVGEISTASEVQSRSVAAVGDTVSQMEQTTQQNAALVEQSAAATENLAAQASRLVDTVAVFKLAGTAGRVR